MDENLDAEHGVYLVDVTRPDGSEVKAVVANKSDQRTDILPQNLNEE